MYEKGILGKSQKSVIKSCQNNHQCLHSVVGWIVQHKRFNLDIVTAEIAMGLCDMKIFVWICEQHW